MIRDRNIHTSWQKAGRWYENSVGSSGHYYHQHVVIPQTLRLLELKDHSSLLDLACGQGILARYLPKHVLYQGIDGATNLIGFAKSHTNNPNHQFLCADVTKQLPITKKDYSHAAIILALQNIEKPEIAIANISIHLGSNGIMVLVLNHPCFRIPRQSSWEIDEKNKLQYRRINRYLTPLKIPITVHPGRRFQSPVTWSFHFSISTLSEMIRQNGFLIESLEEWVSDKKSEGRMARMENRGRNEFPLFLAIKARKIKK